jgi:hypothetical protein
MVGTLRKIFYLHLFLIPASEEKDHSINWAREL